MNIDKAVDLLVESLSATTVEGLRNNPIRYASDVLDFEVVTMAKVPGRSTGWCDGVSFTEDRKILYRPTNGRRENFTICHEICHHLVAQNDDVTDWVYDQSEPDRVEEEICDRFASKILIPDSLLLDTIGNHGHGPQTVLDLYRSTQASYLCCAVRLVRQLPCRGFITIIDSESNSIIGTARKPGTKPYPWVNTPIPSPHALDRLSIGQSIRTKSWWPASASRNHDYYLNATKRRQIKIAMFTEDDLWNIEKLHLPKPQPQRYEGSLSCPCDYNGNTPMYPCNTCGESACPRCKKCRCDWREQRETKQTCTRCWLQKRSHLVKDGICKECASTYPSN